MAKRHGSRLVVVAALAVAAFQVHAATINVASGGSIQSAINSASAGDTIDIAAGTYVEQLVVSKSLAFAGAGAGQTIVQAPASLTSDATIPAYSPSQATAIVKVDSGATVAMSALTISGPGSTGCGSLGYGVFVGGAATLTFTSGSIVHARDNPLSGCQNGVGIRAGGQSTSQTGTLNISNSSISDFQKSAIVVDNTGSSAFISNNAVTGAGPQPIAANGIQISRGATAVVSGNVVTGNECNIASPTCGADPTISGIAQSSGILLYDAGAGTTLNGNTISGNDTGIQMYNDTATGTGPVTATGNTIMGNRWENVFVESATLNLQGGTIGGTSNYAIYALSAAGDTANSTVLLGCSPAISGTQQTNSIDGPTTVPSIQATACLVQAAAPAPLNSRFALCLLILGVAALAHAAVDRRDMHARKYCPHLRLCVVRAVGLRTCGREVEFR